jgi:hypothetical protein
LVTFRVLLQSSHQPAQQFRWKVTPVRFSDAFSLLIKDERQRKLSFYGGRTKHFVNASSEKKGGGLFVERILISTVKINYEAREGIEIKKYVKLIRKYMKHSFFFVVCTIRSLFKKGDTFLQLVAVHTWYSIVHHIEDFGEHVAVFCRF